MKILLTILCLLNTIVHAKDEIEDELKILSKIRFYEETSIWQFYHPFYYVNGKVSISISELAAAKSLEKKGLIKGTSIVLEIIKKSKTKVYEEAYLSFELPKDLPLKQYLNKLEKFKDKSLYKNSDKEDPFLEEEREERKLSIHHIYYVLTPKGQVLKKEIFKLLRKKP